MNKKIVTNPKYRQSKVAFSTPTKSAISLTYLEPSRLNNPKIDPIIKNNLAKMLANGLMIP